MQFQKLFALRSRLSTDNRFCQGSKNLFTNMGGCILSDENTLAINRPLTNFCLPGPYSLMAAILPIFLKFVCYVSGTRYPKQHLFNDRDIKENVATR